jgi:hypothetical protein
LAGALMPEEAADGAAGWPGELAEDVAEQALGRELAGRAVCPISVLHVFSPCSLRRESFRGLTQPRLQVEHDAT